MNRKYQNIYDNESMNHLQMNNHDTIIMVIHFIILLCFIVISILCILKSKELIYRYMKYIVYFSVTICLLFIGYSTYHSVQNVVEDDNTSRYRQMLEIHKDINSSSDTHTVDIKRYDISEHKIEIETDYGLTFVTYDKSRFKKLSSRLSFKVFKKDGVLYYNMYDFKLIK